MVGVNKTPWKEKNDVNVGDYVLLSSCAVLQSYLLLYPVFVPRNSGMINEYKIHHNLNNNNSSATQHSLHVLEVNHMCRPGGRGGGGIMGECGTIPIHCVQCIWF